MIEVTGNLWEYPADWRVITTNGTVKKNGECVMGRGCAYEAKQRYKELPKALGKHLKLNGNIIAVAPEHKLITFPVKHDWYDKADLELITKSVRMLNKLATNDKYKNDTFVMPRPGCGNGQLQWEDVRPLLMDLPDNVKVITFANA